MFRKIAAVITVLCLVGCGAKFPEAAEPALADNTESAAEITELSTFEIQTAATVTKPPETTTETPSETTSAVTTAADTETRGSVSYLFEDDYDKRTEELFTALINKDKEQLKFFAGARSEGVFDFLDNVSFGGFMITPGTVYATDGSILKKEYSVLIEVLESSDPRFPEGENTYKVAALEAGIGPFFSPLTLTGEPEKLKVNDLIINEEDLRKNASICYFFTLEMQPFYGRESADSFEISADEREWFYSCMSRFFGHVVKPAGVEFTPDEFNSAAKSILDIDAAFDETNIDALWYGANITDAVLVSETDNSVVIDWYADSLLLEKAFTTKYNFDTTDGFRLLSVENLYDSGFMLTSYTT
jgi:hypothetical protein